MEPHGVVEADHHEPLTAPREAVGGEHVVGDRLVGDEGGDGGVEVGIVPDRTGRPPPDADAAVVRRAGVRPRRVGVAELDGPGPVRPVLVERRRRSGGQQLGQVRQLVGSGEVGVVQRGRLPLQPVLGSLEGGGQAEQLAPVAEGADLAMGEGVRRRASARPGTRSRRWPRRRPRSRRGTSGSRGRAGPCGWPRRRPGRGGARRRCRTRSRCRRARRTCPLPPRPGRAPPVGRPIRRSPCQRRRRSVRPPNRRPTRRSEPSGSPCRRHAPLRRWQGARSGAPAAGGSPSRAPRR